MAATATSSATFGSSLGMATIATPGGTVGRSLSLRAPPHPASMLSPKATNNANANTNANAMVVDEADPDAMCVDSTQGDGQNGGNLGSFGRSRSRSRSRRGSDNDSAQDLSETPPPPLVLEPFQLTHPTAGTLDFYASLLASVALSLWAKRPLPSTPVQCANCHQLPLTALLKHLLVTTKLPLEQFYLALKYVQVLVSSYPELVHVSKPGSEIRVTIAAIILANKLMEDNYISKRSWARVSSLSLQELNRMELEILDGLHWNLEISVKEYDAWIHWVGDLRRYWRKIFMAPYDPAAAAAVAAGGKGAAAVPVATVPSPSPQNSPATPTVPRSLRHQDSAMSLHSPTVQVAQPPTPRRAGAPGGQQMPPIRTRTGRSRAVSDSVHRPAVPELPPPGTMPSLPAAAIAANNAAAAVSSMSQKQSPASQQQPQQPQQQAMAPSVAPHLRHQSANATVGRMRSASHSTRLRPDWAATSGSSIPTLPAPSAAHLAGNSQRADSAFPPPTATPSNLLANLSLASPSAARFPPPTMHAAHPVHLAMPTPRRAMHPAAALTGAPGAMPRYAPGGAGVGPMTGDMSARLSGVSMGASGSSGVPVSHLAMAAVVPITLPPPRPTAAPATASSSSTVVALHPVHEHAQQPSLSRSGSLDHGAALPVAPEYADTTGTGRQQQPPMEPAVPGHASSGSAFDLYTHRFDYD